MYIGTGAEAELRLPDGKSVVVSKSDLLPELVVWNPAAEKAAALPDMPDGDWQKFVCLEPATVYPDVTLAKGDTYAARIVLSVRANSF